MLRLMVSYNVGIDYNPIEWFELDKRGRVPAYIQNKMNDLDTSRLRWYVDDDETGEYSPDFMCAIHKDIIFTLNRLNKGGNK